MRLSWDKAGERLTRPVSTEAYFIRLQRAENTEAV